MNIKIATKKYLQAYKKYNLKFLKPLGDWIPFFQPLREKQEEFFSKVLATQIIPKELLHSHYCRRFNTN